MTVRERKYGAVLSIVMPTAKGFAYTYWGRLTSPQEPRPCTRNARVPVQIDSGLAGGLYRAFLAQQSSQLSSSARAALEMLNEITSLDDDWNGRGGEAPSALAVVVARRVLEALHGAGLEPERLNAMPEGGVAIYCFGSERIQGGARARYARIAIANDDPICLTLTSRSDDTSTTRSVRDDIPGWSDAVESIGTFLRS